LPIRTGRELRYPRPVLQNLFLELRGTVDPVHDVEGSTHSPEPLPDPVAQPATEPRGLVDETQSEQREHEKDASRTQV
jgi:hypothetical protein